METDREAAIRLLRTAVQLLDHVPAASLDPGQIHNLLVTSADLTDLLSQIEAGEK